MAMRSSPISWMGVSSKHTTGCVGRGCSGRQAVPAPPEPRAEPRLQQLLDLRLADRFDGLFEPARACGARARRGAVPVAAEGSGRPAFCGTSRPPLRLRLRASAHRGAGAGRNSSCDFGANGTICRKRRWFGRHEQRQATWANSPHEPDGPPGRRTPPRGSCRLSEGALRSHCRRPPRKRNPVRKTLHGAQA